MNDIHLIGNLTFDPADALQYTPSGKARVRFQIAVNRRKKNPATGEWEDAAEFPYLVAWDKQAENLAEYQKKGSKIAIVGHISAGSYEKDGEKKCYQDLVADKIEYLTSKSSTQGGSAGGSGSYVPVEGEVPF